VLWIPTNSGRGCRVLLLDGSTEFRILVCGLGLFLLSSNPCIMCSLFCSFDIFVELISTFSGLGLSVLILLCVCAREFIIRWEKNVKKKSLLLYATDQRVEFDGVAGVRTNVRAFCVCLLTA
jgi:hypothetical protein